MPARLEISPKDKRDLFRRYAKGETPLDLSRSRSDLKLTVRQISNLISREGWSKQKGQIAEVKRRAASEVLAQVREDSVDELEQALRSVKTGIATDAKRLEDGWDLVEDAAGASALQRAKSLHLNRLFKLHGFDRPTDSKASARANIALVFGRFPSAEEATAVMDVTTTEAEPDVEDVNFEFDDDDEPDKRE